MLLLVLGKAKKGCHAEALEACALGIVNYALAIVHNVKAFAHMLRVPQHDTPTQYLWENINLPNTCSNSTNKGNIFNSIQPNPPIQPPRKH